MSYPTITGVITYRQCIALPPDAAIAITLQDVSRADSSAIDLASVNLCTGGRQVPIPFVISYDPSKVDSQHTYAVRVQISVNGQLRFLSMNAYPVITRGRPTTVEIVVDPIG